MKLPSLYGIDEFVGVALINRCQNGNGVSLLMLCKGYRVPIFIFPAFHIQFKSSFLAGFVAQFFRTALNPAGSGTQFYGVAALLAVMRRFYSCATSGGRFPMYRLHKS